MLKYSVTVAYRDIVNIKLMPKQSVFGWECIQVLTRNDAKHLLSLPERDQAFGHLQSLTNSTMQRIITASNNIEPIRVAGAMSKQASQSSLPLTPKVDY